MAQANVKRVSFHEEMRKRQTQDEQTTREEFERTERARLEALDREREREAAALEAKIKQDLEAKERSLREAVEREQRRKETRPGQLAASIVFDPILSVQLYQGTVSHILSNSLAGKCNY